MTTNQQTEVGAQLSLSATIPQVFYDIIGRFIPGIVFIAATSYACGISAGIEDNLVVAAFDSVGGSVTLLLGSYMTAAFLGAFWGAACHWVRQRENATQGMHERIMLCAPELAEVGYPDVSFAYDYIQWWSPAAGARMAKLRAEQHLCGVAVVGSVLVALITIMCDILKTVQGSGGECHSNILLPACAFSILGGLAFHRHLTHRLTHGLANLWVIAHRTRR